MKRFFILLLLVLLILSGCKSPLPQNEVEFFYFRDMDSFQFDAQNAALVSEVRSFTNPTTNLTYLLGIYLQGPQEPALRSPFPAGTRVLSAVEEEGTLYITLDASFVQLENLELTLACACLAKTCLGISEAEQVCIRAEVPATKEFVSMTIHRDQLLLQDTTQLPTEAPTETN